MFPTYIRTKFGPGDVAFRYRIREDGRDYDYVLHVAGLGPYKRGVLRGVQRNIVRDLGASDTLRLIQWMRRFGRRVDSLSSSFLHRVA